MRVQLPTRRLSQFRKGQRGKWLCWAIVSTTAKSAERPARVAMARMAPMPPMGGAQLTPDQVSAVAAYIWGLSHH
jgi:mono/diheme cytochrome c family protein